MFVPRGRRSAFVGVIVLNVVHFTSLVCTLLERFQVMSIGFQKEPKSAEYATHPSNIALSRCSMSSHARRERSGTQKGRSLELLFRYIYYYGIDGYILASSSFPPRKHNNNNNNGSILGSILQLVPPQQQQEQQQQNDIYCHTKRRFERCTSRIQLYV